MIPCTNSKPCAVHSQPRLDTRIDFRDIILNGMAYQEVVNLLMTAENGFVGDRPSRCLDDEDQPAVP